MKNKEDFEDIRMALSKNNARQAQQLVKTRLEELGGNATLFYLLGQTHMKMSEWQEALNCFLQAEELEPNGPAHEYLDMLNDIMAFYNKDMYNQ